MLDFEIFEGLDVNAHYIHTYSCRMRTHTIPETYTQNWPDKSTPGATKVLSHSEYPPPLTCDAWDSETESLPVIVNNSHLDVCIYEYGQERMYHQSQQRLKPARSRAETGIQRRRTDRC